MDLNHRPPGPEPGALARLRYAPTDCRSKKETPLERTQRIAQLDWPIHVSLRLSADISANDSAFIAPGFALPKGLGFQQQVSIFTAALSLHPEDESTAPP